MDCSIDFILALLLLLNSITLDVRQVSHLCLAKKIDHGQIWVPSENLTSWYSPFDQCIVSNPSNASYEKIIRECEGNVNMNTRGGKTLPPMRCRVGNSWPSKSTFCSAEDLPFANRTSFRKAMAAYDDPTTRPLASFFSKLQSEDGALLLIGDSVTQQFFGALACELEREGIWTDPNKFTNTDEIQYVQVKAPGEASIGGKTGAQHNHAVPVSFLPIYHMVNGRWDRIPNANFEKLKSSLEQWVARQDIHSLVLVINMGLHYVDNPVKDFTPADYESQMTMVLVFLHRFVANQEAQTQAAASQSGSGSTKVRVFWRETSAQHFPTPNGYWPGQRYSHTMRLQCEPVADTSPSADWRNRIVEKIIRTRQLSNIKIIRFYKATLPLFAGHPNGGLKDCTHFCWTPMLYQSVFHDMNLLLHNLD